MEKSWRKECGTLALFWYTDGRCQSIVRKQVSAMSGLSEQQQHFVAYRLSGHSVEEAAKQCGITPRTGYRWANTQVVQDAMAGIEHYVNEQIIEQAAQNAYEVITGIYQKALQPATQAVVAIALDSLAPAPARLKAAQMIQDRMAPALPATDPQQTDQVLADQVLLSYLDEQELAQFQRLVELAQERRQKAEEKITPIRKQA
jgi:Homeodomain-like domain-containing protein